MSLELVLKRDVPPRYFWSIADEFPDLFTRLLTQVRLSGSLGLHGSVLWLKVTEGTLLEEDIKNTD